MSKELRELANVYYGQSPAAVIDQDGVIPILGTGGVYGTANKSLYDGPAIVVPRKGSLGNPQLVEQPFWPVDTTYAVIPKTGVDTAWLFYNLDLFDLTRLNEATGVPSINRDWLYRITFHDPGPTPQREIGTILRSIDHSISCAAALINKYQRIKFGLMHDLFNRGLDQNGRLRMSREDAPYQYRETSIGWIPGDWSPFPLGSLAESLVDGPFGSNLKTEHYVEDGGVRVVRLQNVQAGFYNDSDKAFVSERHARFLSKNSVVSGDVLIAALGDENYPVGRACLYPTNLPPAINKADCFRLRSLPSKALNSFIMNYLNTPAARSQIDRYKQGVTRQRVNTTNLKKVIVPLPPPDEQKRIADRIALAEASLHTLTEFREKLLMLKRGLMNDLLNGTIPVVVEERIEAQANV
jgi:type I restriction enzyme S subunit